MRQGSRIRTRCIGSDLMHLYRVRQRHPGIEDVGSRLIVTGFRMSVEKENPHLRALLDHRQAAANEALAQACRHPGMMVSTHRAGVTTGSPRSVT